MSEQRHVPTWHSARRWRPHPRSWPRQPTPSAFIHAGFGVGVRSRRVLTFFGIVLALIGAGILGVLLVTPLGWREQAIAGSVLIAGAALLSGMSRSAGITLALITLSLFATVRYGYWRSVETWKGVTSAGHLHQWDTVFVLLLLAAEFYAFATLALGYFQTLRPLRRQPVPLAGDPRTGQRRRSDSRPTTSRSTSSGPPSSERSPSTIHAGPDAGHRARRWTAQGVRGVDRPGRCRLHDARQQRPRKGRQHQPRARAQYAGSSSPSSTRITCRRGRFCR